MSSNNQNDQPSTVPFPSTSTSQTTAAPPRRPLKAYASNSSQPFSRSAAKRQSVMALGSIAHLQHQYIKLGLGALGPTTGATKKIRPTGLAGAASLTEEPEELGEGHENDDNAATPLNKGVRPAKLNLGRIQGLKEEETFELPPSPAKPQVDRRMPWEIEGETGRSVKGEKELRKEVLRGLEGVCEKWGLITSFNAPTHPSRRSSQRLSSSATFADRETPDPASLPRPFSSLSVSSSSTTDDQSSQSLVLDLLHSTTATIRSVQQYVVCLPKDAFESRPGAVATPSSATFSTTTTAPSTNAPPTTPNLVETSPLITLRQSSLSVLGALKALEQRSRLQVTSPLPQSSASDSSESLPALSSTSTSEEDHASSVVSGTGSAGGFEYRPVTLDELGEEKDVVAKYVEIVDRVLFRNRAEKERERRRKRGSREASSVLDSIELGEAGSGAREGEEEKAHDHEMESEKKDKKWGHRRTPRLVSQKEAFGVVPISSDQPGDSEADGGVGGGRENGEFQQHKVTVMVEREEGEDTPSDVEDSEEDELPGWAGMDEGLDRTVSVLISHLPGNLLPLLSVDVTKNQLLESLSDGHILCIIHNSLLRESHKPFGFISVSEIHDLVSVGGGEDESPAGEGRRVSSLGGGEKDKVGATFRRIRNLELWAGALKIRYLLALIEPKTGEVKFDPKLVGRKEAGWEQVLWSHLQRWIAVVVKERREDGAGY
ncbi:hypothetical protein T439DRAFT_327618 [Meredithblackwellia eburnea MCA 4105]